MTYNVFGGTLSLTQSINQSGMSVMLILYSKMSCSMKPQSQRDQLYNTRHLGFHHTGYITNSQQQQFSVVTTLISASRSCEM